MKKNSKNPPVNTENMGYLPDFCKGENILLLILVLELIAIVLALASYPASGKFFVDIALISMFIQWIGLASAGLLCLLRRLPGLSGNLALTLASLLVVSLVTVLMSIIAFQMNHMLRFGLFDESDWLMVILRHLTISLVLLGLALRYFFVQFSNRNVLRSQSRARLQALQARIRPHFLFNSLNTIASLTHDQPDKAERAIEGLAELFRASLKADTNITLQQEIEFTREYIELESLRLDDRLRVQWQVDAAIETICLPALTLQPLVENAIYHGIEPLPGGGEVSILIHETDELLIKITNPLNPKKQQQHSKGNQMALDNIRERLELAFHGEAKIEHLAENDLYSVIIQIPCKTDA